MFWSAFLGVLAALLTYYFARPLLRNHKLIKKVLVTVFYIALAIFSAIMCMLIPYLWIAFLLLAAGLFLFGVRNPRTGQVLFAEILGMKPHQEIVAEHKELMAQYEKRHPNVGKEPILMGKDRNVF